MNDSPTFIDPIVLEYQTLHVLPQPPHQSHIDLDPSARLLITGSNMPAPSTIPIDHLWRIVINERVSLSGSAWRACAQAGRSIALLSSGNQALGYLLPTRRISTPPGGIHPAMLADPRWWKKFDGWLPLHKAMVASHVAIDIQLPERVRASAEFGRNPAAVLAAAQQHKFGQPCDAWYNALAQHAQHNFVAYATHQLGLPEPPAQAELALKVFQRLGTVQALYAHTYVYQRSGDDCALQPEAWALQCFDRHKRVWLERAKWLIGSFHVLITSEPALRT